MLKKSAFYDFLDRRDDSSFERFIAVYAEDEDYINWNGYLMPMHYSDAQLEYFAIRESCAMCDVSPMRKIRIQGKNAGQFFDHLLTRPISTLPSMQAAYTVFCTDDGNLKDDAIVYKFANDDYLMMPSDVDHSPYFESVCERFDIEDVIFTECTASLVGAAIQGPRSADALRQMGFADIELLDPFAVRDYVFEDGTIRVARMGFTADLGYECWLEPEQAEAFTRNIESVRIKLDITMPGYGLSALQACRLEGGFIVAGWDCATEIDPQPGFERTPFELGLPWLVDLGGENFVGRDALIKQQENGQNFVLRSFSSEENLQVQDRSILVSADGDDVVGEITCSHWSWGLQKTIGNASIKLEHCDIENAWTAIDSQRLDIVLSRGPHIMLERRNQVPAKITI
jgi:aminomethyltransferase